MLMMSLRRAAAAPRGLDLPPVTVTVPMESVRKVMPFSVPLTWASFYFP